MGWSSKYLTSALEASKNTWILYWKRITIYLQWGVPIHSKTHQAPFTNWNEVHLGIWVLKKSPGPRPIEPNPGLKASSFNRKMAMMVNSSSNSSLWEIETLRWAAGVVHLYNATCNSYLEFLPHVFKWFKIPWLFSRIGIVKLNKRTNMLIKWDDLPQGSEKKSWNHISYDTKVIQIIFPSESPFFLPLFSLDAWL